MLGLQKVAGKRTELGLESLNFRPNSLKSGYFGWCLIWTR